MTFLKSRVHIVSFATKDYVYLQNEWNASCIKYGLKNLHSFTEDDLLSTDFYKEYKHILQQPRGAGYWLWKPWLIKNVFNDLKEGDILFYADVGCRLISNPAPIFKLARVNHNGLVSFNVFPEKNRSWTKRDAFVHAGLDRKEIWDADKVIATTMLFTKNEFCTNFINEWLALCCNENALTDLPNKYGNNLPGYVEHRWDQGIFSILIAKYGIETYRNPSIWGNWLKMPRYRVPGEPLFYPYQLQPGNISYAEEPQTNSPYGTLFEFNRKNFYYRQPEPGFRARLRRRLQQWVAQGLGQARW